MSTTDTNLGSVSSAIKLDVSSLAGSKALAAQYLQSIGQSLDSLAKQSEKDSERFRESASRLAAEREYDRAAKEAEQFTARIRKTWKDAEKAEAEASAKNREAISSIKESFASGFKTSFSLIGLEMGARGLFEFAKSAIETRAEMDALNRALVAVAGSEQEAARQMVRLKDVAKLPGLGLEEAVRGSVRLQNAGLSAKQAEDALRGFGNAIAAVGGGKAELDGVTLALSQIAAKGKVTGEELPCLRRGWWREAACLLSWVCGRLQAGGWQRWSFAAGDRFERRPYNSSSSSSSSSRSTA